MDITVAGAGIGGLSAALALAQAGHTVTVKEKTPVFDAVGAGIQLGPNAVRILQRWGLADALRTVAATPTRLNIWDAVDGRAITGLAYDAAFEARYLAPNYCLHRADLHQLLLDAALAAGVRCDLGAGITPQEIQAMPAETLLIGADGLHSVVREHVLKDGAAHATGHVAFRALIPVNDLPPNLAANQSNVWWGPRQHVVAYPVKAGAFYNIVAITHGAGIQAFDSSCAALQALLACVPQWSMWTLYDRPALRSASQYWRGNVVLLGDAAHPMRPYLAQGGAMAIEDAACLAQCLSSGDNLNAQLTQYATIRQPRNARVVRQSQTNGQVFHANGLVAKARNLALRSLGERASDMGWLYGYGK